VSFPQVVFSAQSKQRERDEIGVFKEKNAFDRIIIEEEDLEEAFRCMSTTVSSRRENVPRLSEEKGEPEAFRAVEKGSRLERNCRPI